MSIFTKLQIGTAVVPYFLKLFLWFLKYKSQETITMLPPSNEYLEISLKMGWNLWLSAQKFIKMVIYKLVGHTSLNIGFCNDITRKENYRSMSLMNKDTEILNKILPSQILQYIKRSIHHSQMRFCPTNTRFI